MRSAALALTVGLALTSCSSSGTKAASPTSTPTTPPGTQGPVVGVGVPPDAFVTADDLGPGWRDASPTTPTCTAAVPHKAERTTARAEANGTLTETIQTAVEIAPAVAVWKRALTACHLRVRDVRLGDAGVAGQAPGGQDAVIVTGADQVLIVLHVHGSIASSPDQLDSWADLALGTSCIATTEGCS